MSRSIVFTLGLLFAAAAFLSDIAPADAQGRIVGRHGDWQVRCERPVGAPTEQCALVQNVEAEDRANVGLTVIFLRTADRQARILRVLAPLGVLLPSGLGLSIDQEEVGLAGFVRCLPEGCIAEVELDDQLISRFESGSIATFVIFQTPEAGIGIPISLNGFTAGFQALDDPVPPPSDAEVAGPATAPAVPSPAIVDATQDSFPIPADDRNAFDRLLEDSLLPWVAGGLLTIVAVVIALTVFVMRVGARRQRRRFDDQFDDEDEDVLEPEPADETAPQPQRALAPAPKRRQLPSSGNAPGRGPRPPRGPH